MSAPSSGKQTVATITVVVITYRHAAYVADCLHGVLGQVTRHDVDYVICDDASPDGTWDIVQTVLSEYPLAKVRAIRHDPNLGATNNVMAALGMATGEYVAVCEGDDVWLDSGKLEKQLDAMALFPSADISFHPAWRGQPENRALYRDRGHHVHCVPVEEVARQGGSLMPSAAIVFRNAQLQRVLPHLSGAPTTDVYLQLWAAMRGGAVYVPEPMALYRTDVAGSWSSAQKGFRSRLAHLDAQRAFVRKLVERVSAADRTKLRQLSVRWLTEKYRRLAKQSFNQRAFGIATVAACRMAQLRAAYRVGDWFS